MSTRRPWSWFAGGLLAAAALVAVLGVLAGAEPYLQVGNADPGRLVSVGAPLLRLVADVAAIVCVGALAYAACCTRPQESGLLSGRAYREVRIAGGAAGVWCASALLLVPFSASDVAGQPLSDAFTPEHLVGLVGALEQPKAWLLTAALAAVTALGCRMALRWQPVAALAGVALGALLPALVTAHGSSDVSHDLAIAALVVHVPAAALWLGVLLAVLRNARSGGAEAELLRRYARLALWCWLALVASGLVLGAVFVPPGALFSGGYAVLLVVKTAVVVALGAGGVAVRRRALRRLAGGGDPGLRGLARLGVAELVLLLAVVGASVGLTHLPLPDFFTGTLSTAQTLLGYDLDGPPTPLRLLTDWRPDLFFAPLAVALAAGYVAGVRRAAARGRRWPAGRTAAWLLGCLTLLLATSSGIGRYAAAMFSMHQVSHMLVGMLVPALLVLGGPLTLLRAAADPAGGRLPRAREIADRLAGSRLTRALTHPVTAVLLFAGSPFAVYFTGVFDAAVRFHWGHMLINAWFLAVGYAFCWPVIGVDSVPKPLPNLARLGMLLAAMPADIVFGALVIGTDRIIGNGPAASMMYQALDLPWVPGLAADQRLGGVLALVIGEVALFVMLAALLARWQRVDEADDVSGLGAYRTLVRPRTAMKR